MKEERIIHLELGSEEADVIGWMRSLPKRSVNETVNQILSAELRSKIARIPCKFSSANEDDHLSCRLVIRDGTILTAVAKIPKGEIKATLVKTIRKHIRKNREMPPVPVGIHGELFADTLKIFVTKMQAKEAEYAGVPSKYSKLCECYGRAYRDLRDEILACYESGDENLGDARLRSLDCDGIINFVFNDVFGIIEKPNAGATFSADENTAPAKPDPTPTQNEPIFVSDEDDDDYWYDE